MVNLPEFTGKDLSEFAENFCRFLRLTGQTHASGRVESYLLLRCCKTKYLEKQVKQMLTKSPTFADVLVALKRQYPTYETDLSIRAEIQNLAVLPINPKLGRVSAPMILNLILSHNSVSWHFRKQHGNLYMTVQSICENSNLLENPFLIWHCTN